MELLPPFQGGLQDLEEFSHIHVIYYFHKTIDGKERVIPYLDNQEHGIFCTRVPARPNSIGISIMDIVEINGCQVRVKNADLLNGTPLLDIKPYDSQFDKVEGVCIGWLKKSIERLMQVPSDKRFAST